MGPVLCRRFDNRNWSGILHHSRVRHVRLADTYL
jgi:hypothetical protein